MCISWSTVKARMKTNIEIESLECKLLSEVLVLTEQKEMLFLLVQIILTKECFSVVLGCKQTIHSWHRGPNKKLHDAGSVRSRVPQEAPPIPMTEKLPPNGP